MLISHFIDAVQGYWPVLQGFTPYVWRFVLAERESNVRTLESSSYTECTSRECRGSPVLPQAWRMVSGARCKEKVIVFTSRALPPLCSLPLLGLHCTDTTRGEPRCDDIMKEIFCCSSTAMVIAGTKPLDTTIPVTSKCGTHSRGSHKRGLKGLDSIIGWGNRSSLYTYGEPSPRGLRILCIYP